MYLTFREYQEWQAEQFASHFCVPTFMLNQIKLPQLRSEAVGLNLNTFNVHPMFANERLDKWLKSNTGDLYYGSFIN